MITHIKGVLVEKNPAFVVIETAGGIGYLVHISLNTFSQIKNETDIKLFTHYVIKEDAQLLYGFVTEDERTLFRLLISVSGIGPNTASLILSSLTVNDTIQAISSENSQLIQSVKGVGAKTAQRVIIELKDKIAKAPIQIKDKISISYNNNKIESLSALVSLGFQKNAAEKVIDKILKEENSSMNVEDLIKRALKLL
ncbi:MAG: Holliday junction branch migration protein RuvA [Bacteroidales bacterium]|jgi:holliday junction DNA helicase RuvA|nr:Holliday junction branch migration protein RuvA [Bacteroidales bacterium]MDD4394696.1 Holliday junction branch migration protein RuvA [Bacteroidales bacterium]